MPAIDPARLSREAERLGALFGSPDDLRRATLDVLEFYAERALRPSDPADSGGGERRLEVPPPVLRAIGASLQKQALQSPDGILPAAAALWAAPKREVRLLACWVLAVRSEPDVPAWLEARAADLEDGAILRAAVERGLAAWRQADGRAYVAQVDRWVNSTRTTLQALGLRALEAGLDLPELDDLQHAFQALAQLPRPVRGEARHAFESVLVRLAERSPAETTRFLLEEIDRRVPGIERLARAVAGGLPTQQRQTLTRALAGKVPARRRPPV